MRRVGVLRGDHGCRLLPPVPTVTIESHGCPGDAGAGRAADGTSAAPGRLTSAPRGKGAAARAGDGARGAGVCRGRVGQSSLAARGDRERQPDGGARAGSAPRTAAPQAASSGLRYPRDSGGPGRGGLLGLRSWGGARRRWP